MKLDLPDHRIKYAREAGQVQRCHTVPTLGSYDIAQHSFNMVCMLRVLYPGCDVHLIWAIIAHDLPERTTGDIPTPAKWAGVVDRKKLDEFEETILEDIGFTHPDLSKEENRIFKGLDMLELFLWTKDQENLGNRNATIMGDRILKWVASNNEKIPDPIMDIFSAATMSWEFLEELGEM